MNAKLLPFFTMAAHQASRILHNRYRLLALLAQLANKIRSIDDKDETIRDAKQKLSVLGRLAKSYASGRYRSIPWKLMVGMVGVIIYFVNPFDLIPDFAPLMGFVDDFGLLLWLYNAMHHEIRKFEMWETQQSHNTTL